MRGIIEKITGKKKSKPADTEPFDQEWDYEPDENNQKSSPENTKTEVHNQDGTDKSGNIDELEDKMAMISDDIAASQESTTQEKQGENSIIEETAIGNVPMTVVAPASEKSVAIEHPPLQVAYRCHLGKVRSRNEDSLYFFQVASGGEQPLVPFGLYIVADGMGGHHAGHEASKKAVTILAREVIDRIYLPTLSGRTDSTNAPQEPMSEVMLSAVQYANHEIHNPVPEKEGGTTVTAALIVGSRLYIAHVGDSRAYLLEDELRQVTVDHSYVRRLMDAGQLTEEEAAIHPQRNMLYRAVGQGGQLEVETFTQTLSGKGKLVLCSDGLWGLVPEPLLEQELRTGASSQETVDSLVEFALMAGGHDNISIIIVDYSF